MDKGLDYSWGRPNLDQVKEQGYTFVSRYLSWLPNGKCITAGELAEIRSRGIEVALNWEFKAGDELAGASAGTEHATEAVKQARDLGYPAGCTIYFSEDSGATAAQLASAVHDYMVAAGQVVRAAGYRLGSYGGYRTIRYLFDNGLIDDGWQTYGWSRAEQNEAGPHAEAVVLDWRPETFLFDTRASIRQVHNGLKVGGADVDLNERYGPTYLMGGAPVATEKTLQHEIHRQDNGYFCGPASTRTTLTVRGIYVSESVLAGKLGTTTAGTNRYPIVKVLNEYLGNIYAEVPIPGQTATAAQVASFKAALVKSIDAGYGVVANVVGTGRDVAGNAYHYTGHFVAVVGYRKSGDEALVSDVAIGRDYWMTTKALAIWIAARGYIYAAKAPTGSVPTEAAQIGPGAQYPLPAGHYYGDIAGPNESHGGYYANEVPVVKAIQQKLIAEGCVPNITNPNSRWADGKFEQPTVDAVKRFQAKHGLPQDGRVGPVTWSALFPVAAPEPTPEPTPEPAPQPEPEPTPEPQPEPQPQPEPEPTPAPQPAAVDTEAIVSAVVAALTPLVDEAIRTNLAALTLKAVTNV